MVLTDTRTSVCVQLGGESPNISSSYVSPTCYTISKNNSYNTHIQQHTSERFKYFVRSKSNVIGFIAPLINVLHISSYSPIYHNLYKFSMPSVEGKYSPRAKIWPN